MSRCRCLWATRAGVWARAWRWWEWVIRLEEELGTQGSTGEVGSRWVAAHPVRMCMLGSSCRGSASWEPERPSVVAGEGSQGLGQGSQGQGEERWPLGAE